MTTDQKPPAGVCVNMLEMLSAALNTGMRYEAARRNLPPLSWSLGHPGRGVEIIGHAAASDYEPPQVADALDAWAEEFNMQRSTKPISPGTLEYRGHSYGRAIEIWGVVDPDAFTDKHVWTLR